MTSMLSTAKNALAATMTALCTLASAPAQGKQEIRAGFRMLLCESKIQYQGTSFSLKTGVIGGAPAPLYQLEPTEPQTRQVQTYNQNANRFEIGTISIEPKVLREASHAVQMLDMLIFARCRSAAMIYNDDLRDRYLIEGDALMRLFLELTHAYQMADVEAIRRGAEKVRGAMDSTTGK